MSRRLAALAILLLSAWGSAQENGNAVPKDLPFGPGEELRYKLVWNHIPVGYFNVSVKPMTEVNGRKAWHFYLTIKTNGFADKIHKVRQFTDSYVSADLSRSLKYRSNQRQGKSRKDIDLEFDWDANEAKYLERIENDKKETELPSPAVDPFAMFYALRMQKIDNNTKEINVNVSDGKKFVNCKVDIVKLDRVKVKGKKYNAYLLEPDLKDLHGIFKKSGDAKLQVWVSDDEEKVPVKVSSKVIVGRFYALLIEHKKGRSVD